MNKQEFWQRAYLAAIRAGVPQNHFSSIADDAVTQLGSRPALALDGKVETTVLNGKDDFVVPATGAPAKPAPTAKA
jgi:hypothetical protein